MTWAMVFTIIGANVGLVVSCATLMLWIFSKQNEGIKNIKNDISNLSNKLDAEVRASNTRTDQLYQMFVELLKGRKNSQD